ncbi:MAG: glycosyltransferase family 1 protein [Microthrixaceae bacterium]
MSRRPHVAVTLTQRWHRIPGGSATSIERLLKAMTEADRADLVEIEPRGDLRRPGSILRPDLGGPAGGVTERGASGDGPVGGPTGGRVRMPLPLPILYDSWARFGRPKISSVVERLDLVHLTVPVTPPNDTTPLVATVHDLFPITHPDLMTTRGSTLMKAGLESIRQRARRVMVPSQFVADECVANGFDERLITVVPWGVDPVEFGTATEPTSEVLDRYGLVGPYVLFVGTMEPRKNLGLLLEAMIRLSRPEVSLVLVGPSGWGDAFGGDGGPRVDDVPSPVVNLGFVPEADLAHLQRGAGAFCFPSLAEGFGLPVLEAMAAGAAVITSAGTACAEVAGDAAVLIDPCSPDELADAIAMLLDDATKAEELRVRGVRRSKEFRWDRAAELTLDVYDAALS